MNPIIPAVDRSRRAHILDLSKDDQEYLFDNYHRYTKQYDPITFEPYIDCGKYEVTVLSILDAIFERDFL